ncbi:response regulator [Shewanella sp. SR44-3]|nr:response regulator [Shewanella sp. SR44-3]
MPSMNKRILIVDDDPEIRELLEEYLSKNGYHTHSIEDGSNLETLLKQGDIDLLILDVMLPGEDGYSLCRRFREKYAIPIIMLTARGDDIDRIIGLEIGADDYLAKHCQ